MEHLTYGDAISAVHAEHVPGWGIDENGILTRYVKTDTLSHTTIEAANKTVTLRSDIKEDVLDVTGPLVQDALEGRRFAFPPTGFSLDAVEEDAIPYGMIHHKSFGPIHITVTPPDKDGGAAYLDVSITALQENARMSTPNHDEIRVVRDLERYIAWAWLALHGYSQ